GTRLSRTAARPAGTANGPGATVTRSQRSRGSGRGPDGRPGRHAGGTRNSTTPVRSNPSVPSRATSTRTYRSPSRASQRSSGVGTAGGVAPPEPAGAGTPSTVDTTKPSDSMGYGWTVSPASPIHSALPGCGRSPKAANGCARPDAAPVTGCSRPASATTTAPSVAGVAYRSRSVSKTTWSPLPVAGAAPAWNPAGTRIDDPSGGVTVNWSRACAGTA